MHWTMTREDLHAALQDVVAILPAQAPLPTVQHVMLVARDGAVILQATDLVTWGQVTVPAMVEEPGTALVAGSVLVDLARRLPSETVTFAGEPDRVRVRSGAFASTLPGLVETLPEPPVSDDAVAWTIEAAQVTALARQLLFAVSKDPGRPILQGVHVTTDAEDPARLCWIATDGARVSLARVGRGEAAALPAGTLPAKALRILARWSADAGDAAAWAVQWSATTAQWTLDGHRLTTRLLDGAYPDVLRVLAPTPPALTVTGPLPAFQAAMDRAAVLAALRTEQPIITLQAAPDALRIQTAGDGPAESDEPLPVTGDGTALIVDCAAPFLTEGTRALSGELVTVRLHGEQLPLEFVTDAEPDYVQWLMPLRRYA